MQQVYGAFEPATGQAAMVISRKRDSKSHIALLECMTEAFPSDRWLVIEDTLSTHHSRETKTALLSWPEIRLQFIPKYASWLNLTRGPWWKQLRSLALRGRRFENTDELARALFAALASTGMRIVIRTIGRSCRKSRKKLTRSGRRR